MNILNETIFGFIDAKKANQKEKDLLILLLNEYACYNGKDGSFLNMMDLEKFDFYFDDATKSGGVLGGYSPIKPFSISAPIYGENANIIDKCTMAFPVVLHELNHAFQFGIPIRNDFGVSMFLMSKIIMPIGYIFNNLITKLIDNQVINAMILKIYRLIGKKDINPDEVHIPFLYKFTIEYDSDKHSDMNEKANEFITKLDKCVSGVRYINRQTAMIDKLPLEDREDKFNDVAEQLGAYVKENGDHFMGLAMKIVDTYDH